MRKSLMALSALAVGFVLAGAADTSAQSLQTWNSSFSYHNTTYSFAMVGTDPSSTNTTTTITAYIIPIRMEIFPNQGSIPHVFDPSVDQWNGVSTVNALLGSPLFQATDWQWGGTDMGSTQYEDAFQRGSFWQYVSINTGYHVLLVPVLLQEQVIIVPSGHGKIIAPNGDPYGEINHDELKADLENIVSQIQQVDPSALAVFVTDNVLDCRGPGLTGCGQAGFHSSINIQTYVWGSFITNDGDGFPPDISSFSHELAEWMDDPFLNNQSPCGFLEVGDPLEKHYITASTGVTWHLQALAFMEYFGDPIVSANGWFDNVNFYQSVCGD